MTRWASPTAILLHKACPRQYFRQYVLRLRAPPTLRLLQGRITHRVLARLTRSLPTPLSSSDAHRWLHEHAKKDLARAWARTLSDLRALHISPRRLAQAYREIAFLLRCWITYTCAPGRVTLPDRVEVPLAAASEKLRGILDAVAHGPEGLELWDYKSGRYTRLTKAIELQLALYALLYGEATGTPPTAVVAKFLRGPTYRVEVTPLMLDWARCEVRLFHLHTLSGNIEDYPCRCGRCPETPQAPRTPEVRPAKLN